MGQRVVSFTTCAAWAVLANPFANMAREIGFDSFGGIAAVLEGARVVLVT